jgi:hypothetical protein
MPPLAGAHLIAEFVMPAVPFGWERSANRRRYVYRPLHCFCWTTIDEEWILWPRHPFRTITPLRADDALL